MNQHDYVQTKARMGMLKLMAARAHRERRHAERNRYCAEHDDLVQRLAAQGMR